MVFAKSSAGCFRFRVLGCCEFVRWPEEVDSYSPIVVVAGGLARDDVVVVEVEEAVLKDTEEEDVPGDIREGLKEVLGRGDGEERAIGTTEGTTGLGIDICIGMGAIEGARESLGGIWRNDDEDIEEIGGDITVGEVGDGRGVEVVSMACDWSWERDSTSLSSSSISSTGMLLIRLKII